MKVNLKILHHTRFSIVKIKKNSLIITVNNSHQMFNLGIINIPRLIPKIMKYCHDCLTPINRFSKEEYCAICKKARALKQNSTAQD